MVDLVPGAVLDGVSVTGRVLVHSSGHGVVLQVGCDWWRAGHVTCVAGRGGRPRPRQARLPRARGGGHRGELPGHAGPLQPRHGQPGNKGAPQCCDDGDTIFGGGAYYCLLLAESFPFIEQF